MNDNATKHWSRIVLDDIGSASRQVAVHGARGGRHAGRWWGRVAAWFRFVHHRRPDTRFAVFPPAQRSAEILAIFLSLVLLTVMVADTLFMTMLDQRNETTRAIFRQLTHIGDSAWILYVSGAIVLGISIYPERQLPRRRRVMLHGALLVAYYLFTTVAFSGLLSNLFKAIIGRARPPFVPEGMVWHSVPFGDNYQHASFPSGHATTAGAFFVGLALLFPRLRVFILLAGFWVAISRPVLGVHFPADIVAGLCLGGAFSWFYARAFARKRLLFAFDERGGLAVRPLPRGRTPVAP